MPPARRADPAPTTISSIVSLSWATLPLVSGITCSEGWYGYTGALPGYNTADYYSPETGITILAWINYQANEPVEGVASVMVRDIARILTPDHIPFVYKEGSESSNR